jgi:hypothetical protein
MRQSRAAARCQCSEESHLFHLEQQFLMNRAGVRL